MATRSANVVLRGVPWILHSSRPIASQCQRVLLLESQRIQQHPIASSNLTVSRRQFSNGALPQADVATLLGYDPIEDAKDHKEIYNLLLASPPLRQAFTQMANLALGLSQRVVGATAARTAFGRFLAQTMPVNTVVRFSNIPEQMHREIYIIVKEQWDRLVDDVRSIRKAAEEAGKEVKEGVSTGPEEVQRVDKLWDDIFDELNVYMKDKVEISRDIKRRSKGARALMGFGLWRFTPWELREFIFDRNEAGERITRIER